MAAVSDHIVRLTTPEGPGTGFIYNPGSGTAVVYLITARHCLHSKNGRAWLSSEMTIGHLTGTWTEYDIPAGHSFIYGSNNEDQDIGLIILPKSGLPNVLISDQDYSLALPPAKETIAIVTGFPFVALNDRKRSLYQLISRSDRDYAMQLQFELRDPLTNQYNDDILVEGYSGSPLIISSGTKEFICGIFLEYENKLKRVIGFDLTLLDQLLIESGNTGLDLRPVETDDMVLSDINALHSNTQRVLNRIRDRVGQLHLPRKETVEQVQAALTRQKMVLLSGMPGSGKSAVVKRVLSEMEGTEVIAIQGEQLDVGSIIEVFNGGAFNFANPFDDVLSSPGLKESKILLIDSIEKILETNHAETILDFFDLIVKRSDIKLVLTCRSYAIDTLKLRFLQQFPAHTPLEVSTLSDEELNMVSTQYPALSAMMAKSSIKALLRIPFNLDKAVTFSEEQAVTLNNELEFKRAMWSLVVENVSGEADANVRRSRGEVLMQIAIKRATLMAPYVQVPELDANILYKLSSDQIIDRSPAGGNSYAAAHDIYEDWALTRYIGNIFDEEVISLGSIQQFFLKLGNASSIRRSFRLWIAEQIQQDNVQVRNTISSALKDPAIATYWQDEMLIAVLQSDYAHTFLNVEKALLFADDFRIYKRCIVLLDVACQEPDFRYLSAVKEKINLYHRVNLVPFGAGWANMIELSYHHLDNISTILPLVVKMILQWKKGLGLGTLPAEAMSAGQILLHYLKEHTTEYSDRVNRSGDADDIEECIRLIFRLSSLIKNETEVLIRAAFTGREDAKPWQLRNLYEKIIDLAIDGYEDQYLCLNLPDLVIEVAEKEWIYIPPTEEELEKRYQNSPLMRYIGSGIQKENNFGLKESTSTNYFPPGPFHSPVLHLLRRRPLPTLHFIVRLTDHAADAYWASDFGQDNTVIPSTDNRVMISYRSPDGAEIQQKGSTTLWNAYRGAYIATPNLLESVLMALEYWLLELGEVITNVRSETQREHYQQIFDQAYQFLLTESKNVSTTAVLISVAYAYRDLARSFVLPLLTVKEFYHWDYIRLRKERSALAPLGSKSNAIFYQRQQFEFNNLEHRKHDLRHLVLNLGFGPAKQMVFEILDGLYTLEPENKQWQLQVNSMDPRRLEVAGEHPEGILVQPKLEGELLAVVEESRKETERSQPILEAASWAMIHWDKSSQDGNSYTEWEKRYQIYTTVEDNQPISKLQQMSGLIAAIGIRDHLSELNEVQQQWCVDLIEAITDHELTHQKEGIDDLLRPMYNTLEVNAAFFVLPLLMLQADAAHLRTLKEKILLAMLRYEDSEPRKALQQALREHIWGHDPIFIMNCIGSMLQFGEVSHHRNFVVNSRQYPELNTPYLLLLIKSNLKWIFKGFKGRRPRPVNVKRSEKTVQQTWEKVFAEITMACVAFDFKTYQPGRHTNFYFVFQSFKLIPADTTQPGSLMFYETMLRHLLKHVQGDEDNYQERYHYTYLQQFHKRLAQFLLRQPKAIADKYFDILVDSVFNKDLKRHYKDKKFELISECLNAIMIETLQNESLAPSFWNLWHRLADKIKVSGDLTLAPKVLLDNQFFSSEATDWLPIHGQRAFYEQFIPIAKNIKSSARLLGSVGFKEMMPSGLSWLAKFVDEEWLDEKNTLIWLERIVIRCFYTSEYRKQIKDSGTLREDLIKMVNFLIDKSASAPAFLIREDFISRSPGISDP